MTVHDFRQQVEGAGLTPRICCATHWQIKGGKTLVNFYPRTKTGTRYYTEGSRGAVDGNLAQAIQAAGPPEKPWKSDQTFPPHQPEPPCEKEHVGLIRRFWRWIW